MLAIVAAMALTAAPGSSGDSFATACAKMSEYSQSGVSIATARMVDGGQAPQNPYAAPAKPVELPSHCLLQGSFERRTGVQGVAYAIGFELRVPRQWNGRFLFQGGGGMDGFVGTALGDAVSHGYTQDPALVRGFAVISTDSGHAARTMADASFARDQQARINYEYAAIGKVAAVGKAMVSALTGSAPTHSYFEGCSNGGRQALVAAQRFPLEFDGIVAGNPAFDLPHAAVLANFTNQVYEAAARHAGAPDALHWFSRADFEVIHAAVLEQCDAADGARDGLVFDHAQCHFDIRRTICRDGQTGSCLDKAKVEAIITAQGGPRDATGQPFAGEWSYDGGTFSDGWNAWQLGLLLPDGTSSPGPLDLVRASLTQYFAYPPLATPLHGGAEEAADLLSRTHDAAAGVVADSTMLSSFSGHGGKLVLVTGWADPIFSAPELIHWYERLGADAAAAGDTSAAAFSRLFLVPGMTHCGGGPSLDDFDALGAVVDWVESGKAPQAIVASGPSFPGVTRPLCAYPTVARYRGAGDAQQAASFECR